MMRISAIALCLVLTGCGTTEAIYQALRYPCPDRAVPRPGILDREPQTLKQLKARDQVGVLTVDTWEAGHADCTEDTDE